MRDSIVREASDLLLALVALLVAAGTLVLVFVVPPLRGQASPEAITPEAPGAADVMALAQEIAVSTPQPTPEVVAVAAGGFEVVSDPLDRVYYDAYGELSTLVGMSGDPYLRLVVRPIERPDLEINFGGELYQNTASTIKAPILLYAIFRDPSLALGGWQDGTANDAYKMIVGSHNSATGAVLAASNETRTGAAVFDNFNSFLHDIVGLPPSVGLTVWNYGPTQKIVTYNLAPRDPALDPGHTAANPITLDALVAFFEFLETPNWIEGAIGRALATPGYPLHDNYASPEAYRADVLLAVDEAKRLMAIPDPEQVTELERALEHVRGAHPELTIDWYGKNGTLRPIDWPEDRWHVNEVGVVTVSQGERSLRCITAYSASRFENVPVLRSAVEYCVGLFNQGAEAGS